ncbi:tetratricopeptide repeat protein [Propioniciclava sp.]|uniref:tetratricopeptide repeat protein n=1 Tax=Propioniciclava sp. TaxID=2038686 RepID=UPI0039E64203
MAECVLLNDDPLSLDERQQLFDDAVATLPAYLGLRPAVDPSAGALVLESPAYAQPLNIAMAAYLSAVGQPTLATSPQELFEGVLEHEANYWERTAKLSTINLDLDAPDLEPLVALATLTDADEPEAITLLDGVDYLNALQRRKADRWLCQVYPSEEGRWGHLLPDRLGEYVVAKQLTSLPDLVGAVISPERTPQMLVRPLRVLSRACVDHEDLAQVVQSLLEEVLLPLSAQCRYLADSESESSAALPFIEALARLVEAIGVSCQPELLVKVSRGFGLGNRVLLPLCLVVDRAAVDATKERTNPALRAEAVHNYAISLADVGRRDEALAPAKEALDLRRLLAEANPAAYLPDLAGSLHNYAIRLADVGRRDEALAPAKEALDLRRLLAEANPAAYLPRLAGSLNNYAISLAEVGRRDEALAPAKEALDLRRLLAEANPAAYLPDLAMSLNNYAISLAEVGRRDEALAPAKEALDLRRLLAEANPAAYLPDLAMSLNNYAIRLGEVGRRDEALAPAKEALDLRRLLAEANPAAYGRQLEKARETLSYILRALGRDDDTED